MTQMDRIPVPEKKTAEILRLLKNDTKGKRTDFRPAFFLQRFCNAYLLF